jgi:transposase
MVFWEPIVNLLEAEDFEFLVVNAQLLRHGLLKASFIPNRNQRELRELVRYRRNIIEERARQHNRIQKVLEGANIKLGSVVTDIMGVSSKDMLHAIANGEEDPEKLASFARGTIKKKKEELELALRGYVNPHQRMMLKTILTHIDFLTEQIEIVDKEWSFQYWSDEAAKFKHDELFASASTGTGDLPSFCSSLAIQDG